VETNRRARRRPVQVERIGEQLEVLRDGQVQIVAGILVDAERGRTRPNGGPYRIVNFMLTIARPWALVFIRLRRTG
jgi:hypothetical protein